MKQQRVKSRVNGSVTIEASLLLPFLIFLLWNLLYLSFFVYDQCAILQGNYCTALRIARSTAQEGEKDALAEKKYKEAVTDKLVCGEGKKEMEITEEEVLVTTEMTIRAPGEAFFPSLWTIRQRQTADVYRPVRFIRLCRSGQNAGNAIWGEKTK